MIDILKGRGYLARALPFAPTKRWATETLQFNLTKVMDYRRGLPRKVPAQHLLIRLLESLPVSMREGDQAYVWAIEDIGLRVANSLRMTSMLGHGAPFEPGWIYGPGSKEIILTHTDDFDLKEARANWRELMPLRVISHPYNDFTLPYLDGSGQGLIGGGWTVLALNVAMLAFQHKCWWEIYVQDNPDSSPGVNLFLSQYPLANLLRSHLDITLYNRTMAMDQEAPIQEQRDPNPFYLNYQQAGQVDRTIDYALTFMSRPNLSFDDWLDCVPQVSTDNVHTWLALPELYFTTQVEWALFVARLSTMGWLLEHNQRVESSFNVSYVIAIRHWVQRMMNGRLYHQGLRGALLDDILNRVDDEIMPYL